MRLTFTLGLLVVLPGLVRAQAADSVPAKNQPIPVVKLVRTEPVLFDKDIQAILTKKCVVCHSGPVKKGKLDLASFAGMMKGGKRGPALVPGKPAESLLVKLSGKTAAPAMPPKAEKPLTPQELALIKLWIEQGAKAPPMRQLPRTVIRPLAPAVHFVRALAIAPDKSLLAGARGNQVHLFDPITGKLVRSLAEERSSPAHRAIVEALAFSPDGKLLASGSFQEVIIWDAGSGTLKHKLTGFADRVVALAFSPDGKLLATGGGTPTVDGEIKLVDVASGKVTASFTKVHSDTVNGLCFNMDGSKLASASADMSVKIFELPSGKFIKKLEGHSHHVLDVSWHAEGKFLASAGADNKVRLWDYKTGEELKRINRGGGRLSIMSVNLDRSPSRVQFIGKTDQFVTAGDAQPVRLYRIEEVTKASNYYTPYFQPRQARTLGDAADYLYGLAVSPDGALIAAGGEAGTIHVYDGTKGELLHKLTPPGAATSAAE